MANRAIFPEAFLLRLPRGTLAQLDKAAQERGQTRSEYAREALRRILGTKPRR